MASVLVEEEDVCDQTWGRWSIVLGKTSCQETVQRVRSRCASLDWLVPRLLNQVN